ncbi:MAG: hypothetical protein DRO11_04000, partial [Methanobacteriota archaeon]
MSLAWWHKLIVAMAVIILFAQTIGIYQPVLGDENNENPVIKVSYVFFKPKVVKVGEYHSVTIQGLPKLEEPGLPRLPIKAARLLVPYGKDPAKITVICDKKTVLGTGFRVEPGQKPVPLSYEGEYVETQPSDIVYSSNKSFPGVLYSEHSIQMKKGYKLLIFTLYPVQYVPKSGELSYCGEMRVEVSTKPGTQIGEMMMRWHPEQWKKDREEIKKMVDNPKVVETYPKPNELVVQQTGLLDPNTPYDYVIITNETMKNAPGPYNFQALVADKEYRGLRATIVTTEWIDANYDGTRPDGGSDLQTKIRNFIIDAYTTWGTEYVLLGGDGDGPANPDEDIIPARMLHVLTTDIPADMYYGCLDGTFDHDGDGIYGEPNDGPGGGEVDLFAEVQVGRAAVDSYEELSNFIRKTLEYENDYSPYLSDVWMAGEYLWPTTWGGDYKDEIKDGASTCGYTTTGFENSFYAHLFNTQTLYDKDYPFWPKSEIINVINSPAHIINHLGHCSTTYCMKIVNSDVVNNLTNNKYFVGYTQGCYPGNFVNGTGDDCISEYLTTQPHGAVAFVSNSRYGWGVVGSTCGPSQYYDRQFWDAILDEGILSLAKANQDSKEDTYNILGAGGFSWVMRWCYYEINLFGDPALELKLPLPLPDFEVEDQQQEVKPGRSAYYKMVIKNREAFELDYLVKVHPVSMPTGWNATLVSGYGDTGPGSTEQTITIPANSKKYVFLRVDSPGDSLASDVAIVEVRASILPTTTYFSTIQTQTKTLPVWKLELSPEIQVGTMDPETRSISYTLTLVNNGNIQDNISLGWSWAPGTGCTQAWSVSIDPANVTLDPGQVANITITIDDTGDWNIAGSQSEIVVTATSLGSIAGGNPLDYETDQASIKVAMGQGYGVEVEIVPPIDQSAEPLDSALYTIQVTNTGNGADTFSLEAWIEACSPGEKLDTPWVVDYEETVTIQPSDTDGDCELDPGEMPEKTLEAKVHIPGDALCTQDLPGLGCSVGHSFHIQAKSEKDPTKTSGEEHVLEVLPSLGARVELWPLDPDSAHNYPYDPGVSSGETYYLVTVHNPTNCTTSYRLTGWVSDPLRFVETSGQEPYRVIPDKDARLEGWEVNIAIPLVTVPPYLDPASVDQNFVIVEHGYQQVDMTVV